MKSAWNPSSTHFFQRSLLLSALTLLLFGDHVVAAGGGWRRTWDAGGSEQLIGFKPDDLGNVYSAALTTASDHQYITVLKHGGTGGELWRTSLPVVSSSNASCLAVAPGYVAVAHDDAGRSTVTLLRSDGGIVWSTNADAVSAPTALRVDNDGNVFVVGPSGTNGLMLVRFNAAGEKLWAREVTNTSNAEMRMGVRVLAVHSNNVFVVGFEVKGRVPFYDVWDDMLVAFIWKCSYDGTDTWYRTVPAPPDQETFCRAFAPMPNGDLFIGGALRGAGVNETLLVRYSADGQELMRTNLDAGAMVVELLPLPDGDLLVIRTEIGAFYDNTSHGYVSVTRTSVDGVIRWKQKQLFSGASALHIYPDAFQLVRNDELLIAGVRETWPFAAKTPRFVLKSIYVLTLNIHTGQFTRRRHDYHASGTEDTDSVGARDLAFDPVGNLFFAANTKRGANVAVFKFPAAE